MRSEDYYTLATMIYHQGMECDAMARYLRMRLPGLIDSIKKDIRNDMGTRYIESKEK